MKKTSFILVVILLLNILSFNVFASDIEHLKWFYSIDDVVYEPKGSGVLKIDNTVMVSANELCELLGYEISESNNTVVISEKENCKNSKGTIKFIKFEIGGTQFAITEKSGATRKIEEPGKPSLSIEYNNEIYISVYHFCNILDLKFKNDSFERKEIILYTRNYLSNEASNIVTFDDLTNLTQKNIAEVSIRKHADEVIITSPLIISDISDTVKNLQLRQNYDSGAGGWLYWVKFKTDTGEIIEYTVSTGEKIDGIQYRAIDDTEVRKCLEHYYNLYKSINGSEWAKEEIAVATEYGILSANNSYNYKANIMREEFCDLAVNMMETAGITLSTTNPQRTLGIRDTDNINVLKLYKAGIILGKEHDKTGIVFAPADFITREEAATILGRIATYLNIKSKEDTPYANYSDGPTISDWARVSVHTMYQLGVMKGVNETEFSPKGSYTVEQTIATLVRLYDVVNKDGIRILDVMKALGCDDYNGQVFIDAYPKQWQGFEEKPIASSNGYFNILPGKLLYSYDRETWNVLYEDVDGKRGYSNLPTDIDIEGARYAWEYNCFVNAPFDVNKSYYSYDNKEWFEGTPSKPDFIKECDLAVEDFPYGITKDSIIYDSENKLYISWNPYDVNTYFSERYQTTLSENKHDKIWVSTDGEKWAMITLPEEVLFFTSAGINSQAKALIIDAAVEFTNEEKEFIIAEEEKAKQLGQGYDKPEYKIEKYIVLLSHLRDIMYSESDKNSVEPDNVNAENLSNKQLEDLQKQVDEGHYPWRLDYEQVITSFIFGLGENVENGELMSFSGDGTKCSGTYVVGDSSYFVELFKPIDKSEHGIWVVRSCKKK